MLQHIVNDGGCLSSPAFKRCFNGGTRKRPVCAFFKPAGVVAFGLGAGHDRRCQVASLDEVRSLDAVHHAAKVRISRLVFWKVLARRVLSHYKPSSQAVRGCRQANHPQVFISCPQIVDDFDHGWNDAVGLVQNNASKLPGHLFCHRLETALSGENHHTAQVFGNAGAVD